MSYALPVARGDRARLLHVGVGGLDVAELEQDLGADEERVGATVLIAVALVRLAGALQVRERARHVAEARVGVADVGERLRDLEAAADREVDADRLERERDGVLVAALHEHRVGERVLRARLLPARADLAEDGDGLDVRVDRLAHATDAAEEDAARAEHVGAHARAGRRG